MHVILCEPEIPPNTGNVIRLCANAGATLHLVQPLGFDLDERSVRRAGLDYHELAQVRVHASFEACHAALGAARIFAIETHGARLYTEVQYRADDALLFGSETRGLRREVLERIGSQNVLRIPMLRGNRSLNLSNAAALVLFEAWRQLGFPGA
ncbi:MAG TPA: tRNA (cytidine(34)-2'-O)-methyltransferase [Steroidobacteraceae bacterium]|nr:tRNA (cytidine(34)-2'-O)-methyltransferase [Steroidobacteraceae bacterium]